MTTMVTNAAETNGATTSFSFLQLLRIRSVASGIWRRVFRIQEEEEEEKEKEKEKEKEEDIEGGIPVETNVQTIFNFNRAVGNSFVKKALVIIPKFPASCCFTLPGLYCLAQIKWQLAPLGFPSPTLHKWYIVCVTSLLTEILASITQWIISAAGRYRDKESETDTSHLVTTTLCTCQVLVF